MSEEFLYQIYAIVEEIPKGTVATYGQIATLAGAPKNARLVGKALSLASLYGDFPCHRVVNTKGRLVPGWKDQKGLLENEKVLVKDNRYVELKNINGKVNNKK